MKKNEAPPAEAPPGPSFVGIVEHILAPPDVVEKLLTEHPPAGGAGKLRDALQPLIEEGTATIDHIGISPGVVERRSTIGSIIEQIYPTEFKPAGAGVWPYPTAFETRNLGYGGVFQGVPDQRESHVVLEADFTEMIGSKGWNVLLDRTRHPGDVFLPDIRSIRGTTLPEGFRGKDPFDESQTVDPALHVTHPRMGGAVLVSRVDPLPSEQEGQGLTRLIFFHGGVARDDPKAGALPQSFQASLAIAKVPVRQLGEWLNKHEPVDASNKSWAFVTELSEEKAAEFVFMADWTVQSATSWQYQSIREIIYPTEWVPSHELTVMEEWERADQVQGKPVARSFTRSEITPRGGIDGASTASSFETRNVGVYMHGRLSTDRETLRIAFDWVRQAGLSVHRRIEVDGEWIPDITFPVFATNATEAIIRPQLGKWMLIHAGSEFTGVNQKDDDHCVLVFLKLE